MIDFDRQAGGSTNHAAIRRIITLIDGLCPLQHRRLVHAGRNDTEHVDTQLVSRTNHVGLWFFLSQRREGKHGSTFAWLCAELTRQPAGRNGLMHIRDRMASDGGHQRERPKAADKKCR